MIKSIIESNENIAPNAKEIEVLRDTFPACFRKDGSFDIEIFKECISDKVSISHEGYELRFLGKSYSKMLSALDTETIIVPDVNHNSMPENKDSNNVYISGDNLDGLKHLLKSYARGIKFIYIDPPYNTGEDGFVYNDKFDFTVESLVEKLSVTEEQAQRVLDLSKKGSSSHSAWLMFMYPRLLLARDLLSRDGIIFISIDKNENSNLKLLCDDVFGEENFVGELPRITKKSGKDHASEIAMNHDFLYCYVRDKESPVMSGISADEKDYKEKDEFFDERGPYKLNQTLDYDSLWYNPAMDFPIEIDGVTYLPGGDEQKHKDRHAGKHNAKDWVWRWSQAKLDFGLENGFVVIKQGNGRPRIYTKTYYRAKIGKKGNQYFVQKIDRDKKMSSLEFVDNKYSNDNATKEIGNIMDKNLFDFPKPTSLIQTLLSLIPEDDFYALDFFSGSATTGDAVLRLNHADGGTRKFILVQLPEKMKVNNEGFETIDELGIARLNRVIESLSGEKNNDDEDLGFKLFHLSDVEKNTIDKMESFDGGGFISDTTIFDSFGASTILTTWLIRDGYGFNNSVTPITLADYTAYWCENHLYLINPDMNEEAIKALIEKYNQEGGFNPQNIVLFGYSFNFINMENLKTNVKILRDSEKNLKVNLDIRY